MQWSLLEDGVYCVFASLYWRIEIYRGFYPFVSKSYGSLTIKDHFDRTFIDYWSLSFIVQLTNKNDI